MRRRERGSLTDLVGALGQRLDPHHEHLVADDGGRRAAQAGVALDDLDARPADAERGGERRRLGRRQLPGDVTQHRLAHRLVGRHVRHRRLDQRLRRQQSRVLYTASCSSLQPTFAVAKVYHSEGYGYG